ncbi:SIS domain-containing protein [Brevundimonas faecalis]|uniref:Glucosamine--fructose-6-phosphate aminotransferase (Isomerizing) n=1 Tax=Brevundimonas faecalis TaxID=947378 RepID=A0ABV2REU8_9CAUL
MRAEDTKMFAEAAESGRIVAAQLAANASVVAQAAKRLRMTPPTAALICGRGSSDNAGVFARYMIETEVGVLTSPMPLAVSSVYGRKPSVPGSLCLAISQSGKSPDLVAAAAAAKAGGAFVIALVNVEGSPLSQVADLTIPLRAGPELSVAATKSFIASLSAAAHLIAEWSGDAALRQGLERLPELIDAAWTQDWSAALPALTQATNLYVVGRGVGFGVAREAALKLKETCGLHAEAFSTAEVRHGPMALVKTGFPVLLLPQSDATRDDAEDLAADFARRGAKVFFAGATQAPGVVALPTVTAAHPALEPILLIQSFYRLAATLSTARGFDPDSPPYLNKVTETV